MHAIARLAVAAAFLLGASAHAKQWTGPMPIVPGTNYTDGQVIRQDHTRYVIPPEACENHRQFQICLRTVSGSGGGKAAAIKCEDDHPWQTASMNWNMQIQQECKADRSALQAASRDAALAARSRMAPAKADAPAPRPTEPIRTYVCYVETSKGRKRRMAWVHSLDEARAKAYESYSPIATQKQDQIDCQLK